MQISKGEGLEPIIQLNTATCCVCPKPGPYIVIFFREVILCVLFLLVEINVREYRRGNQKLTI